MAKIVILFGTRPEVIKLAPVIRSLERLPDSFETINVSSSQHTSLLHPFAATFDIRIDHDLDVMRPDQSPDEVCARVINGLNPILRSTEPDMILVQGDTTTSLAGALGGFYNHIPVGHVEAGLRSGNAKSPFPEEMNRRLISQLADLHFASTGHNEKTLLAEGVDAASVFVTGNPVVDALQFILGRSRSTKAIDEIITATEGKRRIVLTTHRRESLGSTMQQNLEVLRRFVDAHDDVHLVFPVHPNPSVVRSAQDVLTDHPRIHLVDPLEYEDFIFLLSKAWLIVSDSGGVQEEAPTLGKPVLILRENTERPEAVECGVAQLVGGDPQRLAQLLDEIDGDPSWVKRVEQIENPFGCGDSGNRITSIIARALGVDETGEESGNDHAV